MLPLNRPLQQQNSEAEALLRAIQGNILKPHGRTNANLLLVQFVPNTRQEARVWMSVFAHNWVTSAWQQQQDALAYRAAVRFAHIASTYDPSGSSSQSLTDQMDHRPFAGLALSARGYELLGVPMDQRPIDATGLFHRGMTASLSSDVSSSGWETPYGEEIHALVLLAHGDTADLAAMTEQVIGDLAAFRARVLAIEEGRQLIDAKLRPGFATCVEHFGYADGISQPLLLDVDIRRAAADDGADRWDSAANLDLVLSQEPDGFLGSFLVYQKLEQDVPGFLAATEAVSAATDSPASEVGAESIGRFQNGMPLLLHRQRHNDSGDTVMSRSDLALPNNFTYADDADGRLCPVHAHIRQMNARNTVARGQRIARRGITYGARPDWEISPEVGPPSSGVGLLFMSFQADLASFRTMERHFWADTSSTDRVAITDYVTLRGGEYFFAPSIPFLRRLDTLTQEPDTITPITKRQEKTMGTLFVARYLKDHGLGPDQVVNARNTAIELFGWSGQPCPRVGSPPAVKPDKRAQDVGFQYVHAFPSPNEGTMDGYGWVAVVDNPDKMDDYLDRHGAVLRSMYEIYKIPLVENGDENVYCRMSPAKEWGSG